MNNNLQLNDWITGKVTINGTYFVVSKGQTLPRIVELTDFSKRDQESIKKEQKIHFDKSVHFCVLNLKSKFHKSYERSEMKTIHLKNEKQQVHDILYLKPTSAEPSLWYWDSSYIESNILSIQDHIIKYKLKGINPDYSFVNSDQSPYSWKERTPIEILTEALFQYYKWLVDKVRQTSVGKERAIWTEECEQLFTLLHEKYLGRTLKKKYQTIYFYLTDRAKGNQAFKSNRTNYIKLVNDRVSGFNVSKINRPSDFEAQVIVINELIESSIKTD